MEDTLTQGGHSRSPLRNENRGSQNESECMSWLLGWEFYAAGALQAHIR